MKYYNDVHNRLYREEESVVTEVFTGREVKEIKVYIAETENVQRFITDAILIFMNRRQEIQSMLWSASGGAYYQDLRKIEALTKQIDNANAELKVI